MKRGRVKRWDRYYTFLPPLRLHLRLFKLLHFLKIKKNVFVWVDEKFSALFKNVYIIITTISLSAKIRKKSILIWSLLISYYVVNKWKSIIKEFLKGKKANDVVFKVTLNLKVSIYRVHNSIIDKCSLFSLSLIKLVIEQAIL